MIEINVIIGSAAREAIDARDQFEALRAAEADIRRRFDGSMFYERRGDREYLLRRRSGSMSKQSLGARAPERDHVLREFHAGKQRLVARVKGLRAGLQTRAPVIAAHGLGRVPKTTARILRRFDTSGWLGERFLIVGTNALFAYEAKAGVRISADATATQDVDILYDARRRISLAAHARAAREGRSLIGVLRRMDPTFGPVQRGGFRAVNGAGFMVDLIEPMGANPMRHVPGRISDDPDDVVAVAIKGLQWLINAPRFDAVAFDEQGLPVWIPTIDPRVFALHKLWISGREDRDALKRRRDRMQALAAARIAMHHLGLSFEDTALSAAPHTLVRQIMALTGDGAAPQW